MEETEYTKAFEAGFIKGSQLYKDAMLALRSQVAMLKHQLQAYSTSVSEVNEDMISMGSYLALEQAMFALETVTGEGSATNPPNFMEYRASHLVYSTALMSFMLATAIDETTFSKEQAFEILTIASDKARRFMLTLDDVDIDLDVDKLQDD
jgi:hypothetical protein